MSYRISKSATEQTIRNLRNQFPELSDISDSELMIHYDDWLLSDQRISLSKWILGDEEEMES